MPTSTDCVFCNIVAGEIPCLNLFEDDTTLAFMDINPANPGHALAIVKNHHINVFEVPEADLGRVILTAQRVATAVNEALEPDGVNLVQANGPGALNSVPHLHFHILPCYLGDDLKLNWGHTPGDMSEVQSVFDKTRGAMI